METKPTKAVQALHVTTGGREDGTRTLPVETPVAIVCNGSTQAVMLSSPLDLEDFAYGFALSEGLITMPDQIEDCEIAAHDNGVEVRLWLSADRAEALDQRRRFMAGPVGCGLCGIDSLDQAARSLPELKGGPVWRADQIRNAAQSLRQWQPMQDQTRAVHAAGFVTPDQGVSLAREDVGRHNAMDKLIGALLREGRAPQDGAIVLTSRVSVELIQKAAFAGVTTLIAVSAPTTLAVQQADQAGITLAALARDDRFAVFSHQQRLRYATGDAQ